MKRFIAALSLAALAAPAVAGSGAPFEQAQLDRQVPDIAVTKRADPKVVNGVPFEQNELDRGMPLQDDPVRLASLGRSTMTDSAIAYESRTEQSPKSPWANDHNVIAPAP